MIDLSRLATSQAQVAAFEGQWHAIEFQPELDVPQRFVIGVALTQRGKLVCFRIAEEAPKLKCFYGQRYGKEVWSWLLIELTAELKSTLKTALSRFTSCSPQIHIAPGQYTSGNSADSAMNRTFQRIVTVTKGEAKPRFLGVPQSDLRAQLARILKMKMSTGYEAISQPPDGLQLKVGKEFHSFDINYDNDVIASSVVSASYASVDAAKLNVMTATSDLYRFLKIRKREQIGLAVLLPSADLLDKETVGTWNTWWANESFKYRLSSNILIAESTRPEELADQVSDWYQDPP